MGLPITEINFKQLAKTAVLRSSRGIVAMILKDTKKANFEVIEASDIPSNITEANQKLIKEALKGNDYSPNKIIVYVLGTGGQVDEALTFFESQEFNTLCYPNAETSDNTKIEAFIIKMKNIVKYRVCGVLYSKASNNYEIVNLTAKNVTLGGKTVNSDSLVARIAGLIEGKIGRASCRERV